MQQGLLCSNCGTENAGGQSFCSACGGALQSNCPNCASIVEPTFIFCPSCGTRLGWGIRLREIQFQLAQTEDGLRNAINQYSSDVHSQIAQTEDALKSTVNQYSSDIQSQQALLGETVRSIAKLVAEEHRMSLSRLLNRSGLGIMGLGLGIIGLSYVLSDLSNLAIIGIIVIASGLLLQIISSFL